MSTVAVDLGKRVSGVAWFLDGELQIAREIKVGNGDSVAMAAAIVHFVLGSLPVIDDELTWYAEKMVDYTARGRRRADLQQLRDVSDVLDGMVSKLVLKTAHSWKGGISKAVTKHRVVGDPPGTGLLAPVEYRRIWRVTKETVDAIGIGLFVEGRARRGMLSV